MAQPSPYTPGALAMEVPGRDPQMAGIRERLDYLDYRRSLVGRVRVFVGPRGVGKTSMLRLAQRDAEARGFTTVWVTTGDEQPLAAALADEFSRLSSTWATSAATALKAALKTLTVSIAGVTMGVGKPSETDAAPISTGRALQDVIAAAIYGACEKTNGLIVFIDEIQGADDSGLKALGYAWQHLQAHPKGLSAMVLAAGLSHSQDVIANAVSFGERFQYVPITNLDAEAAEHALVAPAREIAVTWDRDALDAVLLVTQGYPYFIQEFGEKMWTAAEYPSAGTVLTLAHYQTALDEFLQSRARMFRSRWVHTTAAEAKMLTAMASLGDYALRRREVAARMEMTTTAISMARRSLMDKGLIEPDGYGLLRFTTPGFGDFIREDTDD